MYRKLQARSARRARWWVLAPFALLYFLALAAQAQIISTVAGTGGAGYSGDGGPATAAALNAPYGIAVGASGKIYVADAGNHVVREIAADGTIRTVAGIGAAGSSGNGAAATAARLNSPRGLAFDAAGNLYIADTGNHVVRRVDASGTISTVAGNGTRSDAAGTGTGDGGPAINAQITAPWGVAVDAAGNLYIAAAGDGQIRKVGPDGIVATVRFDNFYCCTSNSPVGIAVDSKGYLYASWVNLLGDDTSQDRVILIRPDDGHTRIIATSSNVWDYRLHTPVGVAITGDGRVYIGDTSNHRILSSAGEERPPVFAGTGVAGYSGDGGSAINAQLNYPAGVAVDAAGNLYIADSGNNRIRKVAHLPTYTVGGTVSGLTGSIALHLNAGTSSAQDLAINANGAFTFPTPLPDGASYTVSITQWSGQTCAVANGSGNVASGNISNVVVTCVTPLYTIGGTVSGLNGSLALRLDVLGMPAAQSLVVTTDGAFTFPTPLSNGSRYQVSALPSPGQTCTTASPSGEISGANVTNIAIQCERQNYRVGGAVSGLAGSGLQLSMGYNGPGGGASGVSTITMNGAFAIPFAIPSGSSYWVEVSAQPSKPAQLCTVANGSGTVSGANVSDIAVTCVTRTYTIGGTVSGLSGRGLVLGMNDGAQTLVINANGSFTFPAAITDGSAYAVKVQTLPSAPAQSCGVSGGSGTVQGANVTQIAVTCKVSFSAMTTTVLFASPIMIESGQSVQLSALVTNFALSTPSGSVTFYDGDAALGNAPLSTSPGWLWPGNSSVTFTATHLAGGSHRLSARYSGDANAQLAPSTSPPITLYVLPRR